MKEVHHQNRKKNKNIMGTNSLKIIQDNCLSLRTNFISLYNTYRTIDPDIILLNSLVNPNIIKIKMFGYDSIQINATNERNDGSAILIKTNLLYKQRENRSKTKT